MSKTQVSLRATVTFLFSLFLLAGITANCLSQTATNEKVKKSKKQSAKAESPADQDDAQDEKTAKKKDADAPRKADHFMRIRKNAKGRPVAMETSITRYEVTNDDGKRITVDLIGVVHIGEQEYYEQLNKRFENYDGLLYELVAPEGTEIPKGGRDEIGMNPIAAMQVGMQSVLGLEFQLDHIDYSMDNFIHADMTPEEFGESMEKNEESVSKYALRGIGQSMAMQSAGKGGNNFTMLFAMFSKHKEIKMRRMFAEQMQNMEAGLIMFEGKDGSTIIDHRNAKCMEVLDREIKAGKKNLAIFYGAGHLPDMERRLTSDFKMKRGGQQWMQAWDLKIPKSNGNDEASKKSDAQKSDSKDGKKK